MQESRENQNTFAAPRRESSSSTLLGIVSYEGLKNGFSREKSDGICIDHACNIEGHLGSSKENLQDDNAAPPDLLPSFEMYENLHSTIPQSSFDTYFHEEPPYYKDAAGSRDPSLDVQVRPNLEDISENTAGSQNSETGINTQQLPSVSVYSRSPITSASNHDGTKSIPVERIYALPRVNTSVAIGLYVTKTAPKFGQTPKYESMLKEFTCGDIIYGYFTVENKSSKDVKFDMFYLTLEDTISSTTKACVGSRKATKRFLRMVDLAASWSYNQEDMNTDEDLCGYFDPTDHTKFGLTNARTLNPGDKRKKFFTFKIPNQLLDTTCKHGHFSHSLLPPSLGFQRPPSSNGNVADIKLSRNLGYGRSSEKGSQLLLMDNCGGNLVDYSIYGMLVGKDVGSGGMCLVGESKYSIRIIPFGFDSKPVSEKKCVKDLENFDAAVTKRLEKIKNILSKSKRTIAIHEEDIRGADDPATSPRRNYLWNPEPENVENDAVEKKYYSEEGIIDTEISYSATSMLNAGLKSIFRKGLHNTSSSQLENSISGKNPEKNGLIMIKVKLPGSSLPYWSPTLIQKQNVFSMKNKQGQQNWSDLRNLLSSEEGEKLESLQIELVCVQAANNVPHELPNLTSSQIELVCLTEKTEDCKPVEFHSDLLLNERRYNEVKKGFQEMLETVKTYCDDFSHNQTRINSLLTEDAEASLGNKELVFSSLMPLSVINDVQALAHMEVDVAVIKNALESKLIAARNLHSNSSSSSMIPQASRSIIKNVSPSSHGSIFSHARSNEWNRVNTTEYRKTLSLHVKFNDEYKGTLVPSFRNCLCSRSYFLRVKLYFDKGAGTSQIDVPIQIRNSHIN
ncbi:hypothetical protein GRS66_010527 [Saccharomyces pastorianus]|uniref:Uncharacterized protein n=1 Tax=Saccharomyces pastorianus TaxID=27292 RepID=A0A6C1EEN0_SACPS|nr:hypothetical protein GRS66_010527 [Saccharomyces pastorianus]